MNILIAGGSGLVGHRLTRLLKNNGHEVAWLSRSRKQAGDVQVFTWDVSSKTIDTAAFEFADAIINLAGAGVADKRWTRSYKNEIYSSRIDSTKFLSSYLATQHHHVQVLVNASAIGIYGNDFREKATENTPPAGTFLGHVCRDWEAATRDATASGVRTVHIRTGIVLSENEGLIGKLKLPVKLYAGTVMGSGEQLVSWIHLDDLCRMYRAAVEDPRLGGPYNAVAPVPTTNKQLTWLIAQQLNRPLVLPNVPAFVLKLALGEMADMLVGSQPVSSEKISGTGFQFRFGQAEEAVRDLLS